MRRHSIADALDIIERRSKRLPNGCVVWLGMTRDGYGQIVGGGEQHNVHRFVYVARHGELPAGQCVLHTCDDRRCWEDGHLYPGTNKRNIADKCESDRSGKKLNIEKVKQIRLLSADGWTNSELAAQFDVNPSNISRAINGKRWAHVPCPGGV